MHEDAASLKTVLQVLFWSSRNLLYVSAQTNNTVFTVLEFNNEFITDKPYTNPEQPKPISKAKIFFLNLDYLE